MPGVVETYLFFPTQRRFAWTFADEGPGEIPKPASNVAEKPRRGGKSSLSLELQATPVRPAWAQDQKTEKTHRESCNSTGNIDPKRTHLDMAMFLHWPTISSSNTSYRRQQLRRRDLHF